MSGRFPPLRFARPQVGAGSATISANNLQSQKPAPPGYYCQSIGHDIIENAARCELKHKISTKMTGLDFVIKSLYTADFTLMKYTRQAIARCRETARRRILYLC
jgi:hypothetical protein